MSRVIDRLPTPEKVKEKKVIVLSRSRVGTFSLYQGLQKLGYTPYHMYEVVTHGTTHLALFEESIRCKYQGIGKPYGKAEFDKWLANYDAIVEIPQFFIEEFIEFYPNAKFILVERDVNAWERSLNNTIAGILKACHSFPMNFTQYFDPWVKAFVGLHLAFEEVIFHNKGMEGGMEEAKKDSILDAQKVKRLVPKDRLLCCTLEGGFGWEQICPFLGKEIPKDPYPRGNAPAQFQELVNHNITPQIKASMVKAAGTLLVPLVGVGMLAYMKW
ncbi:hypothetical protein BBK36DRAFT_1127129 [Trichoderma citrinoviride]|uniref:P-loop containing nucleoside triphosphate hydrolase protein n=1 Tax=Trichoderma citrinoviride TaxID=58853 RepID=A0A2T4B1D2_9HYPO|nr:hypothetical protein BBK36DRAFT_1127129 [Trichoderma citrinoviride]PTB63110.1 hypothetical protein BBK36DRAFT_1127129 [Trichoderma citrinoviride]